MDSTAPKKISQPILLIDRANFLAEKIAKKLTKVATVIIVSQQTIESEDDIIFVPFLTPTPQIPGGTYSKMLFVWEKKYEHILEPLLEKAKEQRLQFFVVVHEEERDTLPESIPGAHILILGDLFDENSPFPLSQLLRNAKTKKRIQLTSMGLHEWYPVLFDDATEAIAKLLIILHDNHRKYFIGPSHPYTALTIAHALQKVDPDLAIDFQGEKEMYRAKQNPSSAFQEYDGLKKIQQTYKELELRRIPTAHAGMSAVFSKPKLKKRNNTPLFIIYLFFVAIFLPLIITAGSGALGAVLLSVGIQDIRSGSFTSALSKITAARQNFSLSLSSLAVVSWEADLVGQSQIVLPWQQKIAIGEKATEIADAGTKLIQEMGNILSGKSVNPQGDVETAIANLQQEEILLQTINVSDIPKQYQKQLIQLQKFSSFFSGFNSVLPQFLGISGDRTYLVLFQNNMELRPGGGFIGSYGLLKLHNGAVKDFSIHDVYDADGQLKGHIEPPFAIRRYIPIVHLYLRDSNFDPDFVSNAQTAAFLLSQETGDKVDGVIGIDLNTIQALLKSVGSVYVASYNETVTEKNFFLLLEKHAEKNFFPGSTQKKDFLEALASALLAKIQSRSFDPTTVLSDSINLLQEKHILLSVSNQNLQSLLTLSGFSDTLDDSRASSSAVINDFTGVVEANLGVNKVNAFVGRQLFQQVSLSKTGDITGETTLMLTNGSDGSWPGGLYRNYIRFILPQNATLVGVALDNVDQHIVNAVTDPKVYEAKSFVLPKGLEIEKETEKGKMIYGFLITVPIKSSLSIKISYVMQNAINLSDQKMIYDLYVWKQAGVDAVPYQLQFTLPDGYAFISSNQQYAMEGQTGIVNMSVNQDTDINFSFAKK